ncbi:penicillin-binding protein 1C [Pollutibacter soli]|uniref:penicillin-binding protein 1C n=1 Tax=Pollutibacter soli TaxID=3034157 RepID=UPI003013E0AC
MPQTRTIIFRRILRWTWRGFLSVGVLFILFLILNFIFPLKDQVSYSITVADKKGEIIHAFLTPDEKWRMKTEAGEITSQLKKAILYKEDRYFYYHPGVNLLAIVRAAFNNAIGSHPTSGASTITMQVARMMDPGKRNLKNKIKESFRALQLEWKYSKDEILLMYLNRVPYGGNIEGVKAASVMYFGKQPDHLSLAEITALSVIPNRPVSLVMGKSNDKIVVQRNIWLERFGKEKLFPAEAIADAMDESLEAWRRPPPQFIPHLANRLKYSGGHNIASTIDFNLQQKTQQIVSDYVQELLLKNIHNASVIIMDNETHEVLSYIGSGNFFDSTDGGQVNGARAVRQPGSTLKPLVFGLCMDQGLITPKTVINDVPVNFSGYTPENYDKQFHGPVTVEYALERSLNIPAVKALSMTGLENVTSRLALMGFNKINPRSQGLGLSLVLGGCGVTLEQLTGMYSCIANSGVYAAPVYLAGKKTQKGTRILSEGTSFMISEILSKVNRPDFPLNWDATAKLPKIAWKTGTSYGRRDGWSIGYNKKYTVGVWTGNFSGEGNPALSGADIATPLLFRIFNTLDYDTDREWYSPPPGCELRMICAETGKIPSAHCGNIIMDYFLPGVSATDTCNHVQEIMVSADERISYCMSCRPESGYKMKLFPSLSPELRHFLQNGHAPVVQIPPHNPSCEHVFSGNAPQILSPVNGTEYLISKETPEPLMLECKTGNDVQKVFWYIDNRYYKTADAGAAQFFMPEEGPVKISCTDDKGRNRDVTVIVKKVDW